MLTLVGWRKEEIRLNEVFKLQFHATQVSLPGVDALTLSLVPADIRKPTQRLQKAIVRDGTCEWEDPAYETIRFVREPQTGKINDRIYHFIVSSGLSKAGIIGEVTIDFADYAEATEPCTLSLPLNDLNPNTVLHVLIHRLHDITNEIEEEETEDMKMNSQLMSLKSHFSIDDTDDKVDDVNFTEDDPSSGSNTNTLCSSCQHDSYTEIKKLKADLVAMAKHAAQESVRAQDLSREVVSLREAKNGLEAERKRLKTIQEHREDTSRDIWALVNEITQELDLEKNKNSNLRLQLHKTQESNAELVLAVHDLDKMLALKEGEVSDLLSRKDIKNVDINQNKEYLETRMEQEVRESSYKSLQEHQRSLDARIESLEDELSKQAREFKTKIDVLVRERSEQEKRAIQAEETLRTAKFKDTNTAEKIQTEFRRLSAQMTSTFEANEKLATKAVEEAADLRMQKIQLQETLRKASEDHEAKIIDLTNHIERMSLENDDKSNQLKLEGENLRVQLEKADLLVQRGNVERSELASKIDSMEKELQRTIHIKQLLEIELATLKRQCTCYCSDLTGFLFEDELHLGRGQARVIGTTGGMKTDDNAVAGAERRVREHSGGLAVSVRTKASPRRNKAEQVCSNLKEVEKMKEKIRSLQVEGESSEITLLTEMASLKERNKSIERQLKEMQERYSEISQFAEL